MFLRLFQLVPAFRLLIAYVFGLVFLSGQDFVAISLVFLSFWFGCVYFYFNKWLATSWNIRWIPGAGFICLWIALGSISGKVAWEKSAYPDSTVKTFGAIVKLETDPLMKKKSYQLQVSILRASENEWKGKKLVLYIQKDESVEKLRCGDKIFVAMRPQKPDTKADTSDFDYARWLSIKGYCATAYVRTGKWNYYSAYYRFDLKAVASRFGSKLVSVFRESGLSGNRLGLASAMSLGYRDGIDVNVETYFRSAGITHILSVSGLHVAVIYSLLQGLFFFLRFTEKQKKLRQLIIVLLLWAYAFITGLSPSVNRSALMFSMISLGVCLEKRAQTLNTVLFSAFILLLWNPLYLYDVGFQLSYCAVTGIVVVYPKMRDLWEPKNGLMKYIRDLVFISLVAQLATVPLTVYYFGQFPNYFLLGNLIAVPLSSLLIFLATGCLLLHFIPYVNVIVSWCLNVCTSLFLGFAETMGGLPFAVTEGIEIDEIQVIVLYLFMYSFFCWFFLKKKRLLFGILLCILCFQVLVLERRCEKQIEVVSCEMVVNQYLCKK